MELTDMIKNHRVKYDGNWDKMKCLNCGKKFFIRADMCDSAFIVKELERIDKIPCEEKKNEP